MLIRLFSTIFLLIFSVNSYAVSYTELISNIDKTIEPIQTFIMAFCFVMGVFCILKSLFMLKQFGMHISQMSGNRELGGPLGLLVVGIMLIYIPDISTITSNSLLGGTRCVGADFNCKTNII